MKNDKEFEAIYPNIKYNKKCLSCQKICKQYDLFKIIRCPLFKLDKSKQENQQLPL